MNEYFHNVRQNKTASECVSTINKCIEELCSLKEVHYRASRAIGLYLSLAHTHTLSCYLWHHERSMLRQAIMHVRAGTRFKSRPCFWIKLTCILSLSFTHTAHCCLPWRRWSWPWPPEAARSLHRPWCWASKGFRSDLLPHWEEIYQLLNFNIKRTLLTLLSIVRGVVRPCLLWLLPFTQNILRQPTLKFLTSQNFLLRMPLQKK